MNLKNDSKQCYHYLVCILYEWKNGKQYSFIHYTNSSPITIYKPKKLELQTQGYRILDIYYVDLFKDCIVCR